MRLIQTLNPILEQRVANLPVGLVALDFPKLSRPSSARQRPIQGRQIYSDITLAIFTMGVFFLGQTPRPTEQLATNGLRNAFGIEAVLVVTELLCHGLSSMRCDAENFIESRPRLCLLHLLRTRA